MVRLVRTIAEKVIHVEVRSRERPILRAVERAIHASVQSEEYRVRVNPEDMSVVTENKPLFLASISGLQNIVIESDQEISRGGCVVESDQGKVDGTIETQLEQIQEQLYSDIASEDT
jgi:flagellar assembly protein FliH